jgi:octaprenyl-diphosphate synthase
MSALVMNQVKKTSLHSMIEGLISPELASVEDLLNETLAKYDSLFHDQIEHLKHYRGKRLRPTLVFLVGHAAGKVTQDHVTLATVIELIHSATLIHDDVLDSASVRRHVATVNARWGNSITIMFGDLLFSEAFRLASTIGDAHICEKIGEATTKTCAGEMKQLIERGNDQLSTADYLAILEGKTGALLGMSCELSAYLSGWEKTKTDLLYRLGADLGIAFQITDDLLDLIGDESIAGKTLGTDLLEEKWTLPVLHYFNKCTHEEKDHFLRDVEQLEVIGIERIRQRLVRSGSIEYSREFAENIARESQTKLKIFRESIHRDVLSAVLEWSIQRKQ